MDVPNEGAVLYVVLETPRIRPTWEIINSPDKIPQVLSFKVRPINGSGKPENIVTQIVEGKLQKYKESISLLDQPWVKDDSKTIKGLVEETIGKIGENIEVRKFARYEI